MLLIAKVAGLIGLVVGITHFRVVGAVLLGLDGALLVGAVVLSIRNMQEQKKQDEDQKDVLARMVREGTLDQFLKDLEESGRASRVKPPRES